MGSPDSVPPGKGSSVEPSKGGCGPSWADMFAMLKGKKGMKGKESMKGKTAMKGKRRLDGYREREREKQGCES